MATEGKVLKATKKTDAFGCSVEKLDDDRRLTGSGIQFYRKASTGGAPGQVAMPATSSGHLIGITLRGGHSRKILSPRQVASYHFDADTIYTRSLSDDYKADLEGTFDFVLLEIAEETLRQIAVDVDLKEVTGIKSVCASPDPILAELSRAIFSTMKDGRNPSALFLDQVSLAMGAHIAQTYGDGRKVVFSKRRTLSRRNEDRAKELIMSRLDGSVSISALADECNLSRGVFIRAFRETTGKTPHQWLTKQRIERAQYYLHSTDLSLAEISVECGFADQSHFSKVFSSVVGATPSIWRRDRWRM